MSEVAPIPELPDIFPMELCTEPITAQQLELLSQSIRDKQNLSAQGLRVYAKVVHVHDGDTCTLKFYQQGKIVQYCVRMMSYDSAELKPRKKGRTEESLQKEKQQALEDKQFLESLIADSSKDWFVFAVFDKPEKFGRQLGTLYSLIDLRKANGDLNKCISLNHKMILHGHGVPYEGGKKIQFDELREHYQ